MRLKAFSLLEIMIAIILSGLVIGTAFSGYLFTYKQLYKFKSIKTEIRNYFELSEVLNREFENAKKITKKSNRQIEIELINKTIDYSFNDSYILRSLTNQTDTFFFVVSDMKTNIVNELLDEPLIDYLALTFGSNDTEKTLSFYKYYGAITKIDE